MFPLICVGINGWVNNRKAGDLRRYRAHYDVIVTAYIGSITYVVSVGSAKLYAVLKWDKDRLARHRRACFIYQLSPAEYQR